jgi:hypothetical protein
MVIMKEVVWVFGASAAGKETFITSLLSPEINHLSRWFGWQSKKVIVCQESIEWVGLYKDDPKIAKRDKIVEKVSALIKEADIVIIKGQDVDLVAKRPAQLIELLIDYQHSVIFINVSISELMERLPQKVWWNGTDTETDTLNYLNNQLDMLAELKNNMKFTAINGNAKGNYEITELPKQLQS